jgi:FtsH-binding integral membrane protein
MTTPAAYLAIAVLAGVALFQVGLAAGKPWRHVAWGGRHRGVLPTRLRIASTIAAAAVYPLLIAYVASSAGLAPGWTLPGAGSAMRWALTGFFLVGAVINAVSRSPIERWWAPIALLVAGCCALFTPLTVPDRSPIIGPPG